MYMQWGRKHIEGGGGGLDLQKKILTRKKMNLDHTNALLFVPFTRSGGGVEAEKILIYNSSSTITGRLSLKCLTIQYFSTK